MGGLWLLILLFLVIAFLLRVDFVFYIIYVCLGVYAWGRWFPRHALRQLRLQRTYHDHAFLGEPVEITLTLSNNSRLRLPWVQWIEMVPIRLRTVESNIQQVVSIKGREEWQCRYEVVGQRRGYYQVGPMYLTLGDLFGFREVSAQLPAQHLTIYPKILPVEQLGLPSRLPFGAISTWQRLFADPARPMGVRPYHSGDSLRQINWKVTARQEQLLVKSFQPAISLETTILLNLNGQEYERKNRQIATEWAIQLAASIAAHLVEKRQSVGLITNGADPLLGQATEEFDPESGRLLMKTRRPAEMVWQLGHPLGAAAEFVPASIPIRTGQPHLMKILELLARLEADDTLYFATWIPVATAGLGWGTTIIVITPVGSLELCQVLQRLVQMGYSPILLLIEQHEPFDKVRERARRFGFVACELLEPHALDPFIQIG